MNRNPAAVPPVILLAEDDPDDRFLAREAFNMCGISGELHSVKDGEQLMDYLLRRGEYTNQVKFPSPSLILLDLNMPRKDGREALYEIRLTPELRGIPVVVYTTSDSNEDREYCIRHMVTDYVTKPADFEEIIDLMKRIDKLILSQE